MYIHEAVKQALEQKCYITDKRPDVDVDTPLVIEPTDTHMCCILHHPRQKGKKYPFWHPSARDLMSDTWELFKE